MAQSREVVYLKDFTGGLNLNAQNQGLRPNETPDCLNVDFGSLGGFTLRGGFQAQAFDDVLDGTYFLGSTYFGSDVVLLADSANNLYSWNGSTLTDEEEDLSDTTDRVVMASFNSKAYFANGRDSGAIIMQSWDGSTLSTLTNTFNDTYTTPNDGDMPLARIVCAHKGYLWVADTVESSVRYPHRVRFSHLQNPEDWATDDYFEVDPGDDGDPIVTLVSFKNYLMVFKRSSVSVVYGNDKDDFVLERITGASGVSSPEAVAANSGVCYWFANDGSVMAFNGRETYDGRGVVPLTDKLAWWAEIGKIKVGGAHRLMWSNGHLYMALEAGSGESLDYWLFVWNPTIKALTRYSPEAVEMFNWSRVNAEPDPLFLFSGDTNLYRFDPAYETDVVFSPDSLLDVDGETILDLDDEVLVPAGEETPRNVRIDGYYRTSWIDAGETATKKRWKRPRVTAAATGTATLGMDVFHDFVKGTTKKQTSFDIVVEEDIAWGTLEWGQVWGDGEDEVYKFSRQPSAGSGVAVQFKFYSNDNTGRWWVNSVAVPFRRRQVK